MKHVKILGLLAVAAAAMMAFAASASATTVTGPGGETTPTIHAVNENGHVSLHNPIANIECQSTASGKVEKHGSGVTASGKISHLTFTSCTGGWVVHVENAGELIVHHTSGVNGTLTSNGATVTATRFGVSCRYLTNETDIGTVTGGNPATLDISASIPFHSGSPLCGGAASAWTGNYQTTGTIDIDA